MASKNGTTRVTDFLGRIRRRLSRNKAFEAPTVVNFPPPYNAMLAVNSDVEWTSWDTQMGLFEEFAKRDLEVAFSFWLFASPKLTWRVFEDDLSETRYAQAAFELARRGLLDTNHSFGGRSHLGGCDFDRARIAGAYSILNRENIELDLYSNHGTVEDRQNVGAGEWASYQEGDLEGSEFYHLDLTKQFGAKFFWCDPDYTLDQPFLGPAIDTQNGIFASGTGRDGNHVLRFRRYFGNLPAGPALDNFHIQLDQILDDEPAGYCVLYQHLGVDRREDGLPKKANFPPLGQRTAMAMDRLALAQANGKCLVTTTRKLLMHAALMAARPWRVDAHKRGIKVVFAKDFVLGGQTLAVTRDMLRGWAVDCDPGIDVELIHPVLDLKPERWRVGTEEYCGFPWEQLDLKDAIQRARRLVAE